jgi:hypothetical protein
MDTPSDKFIDQENTDIIAKAFVKSLPITDWEIVNQLSADSDYDYSVEVNAELDGVTWAAVGTVSCGELIEIDHDTVERA